MNAWTLFADLFTQFDATFLAQVTVLTAAIVNYVQMPLIAGVSVWIAGTASQELLNPGTDPIFMLVRKVIRAALIIAAVTLANYTALAGTFLLVTLPNEITTAISGATPNGPVAPASFDMLLNGAWGAGLEIYKNISGWSAKAFGLSICVVLFWGMTAIAVAVAFVVFLASHVLLGLVIVIGPLCVCLLLWERTVPFFNGWLGSALALIATQVLVVGLLALLLPVVSQILRQIAALNGTAGINVDSEFAQLHYLIEAGVVIAIMVYLATQLPDLARTIFGGATAAIAPITRTAQAAVSGAGGMVVNAANAMPGAGLMSGSGSAAGMRSTTPAGRAP